MHLTEDVLHFGPLESFAAYPFENYLQVIKNLTRRSARPLQQIVKRLNEIEVNRIFSTTEEDVFTSTFEQHFEGPILRDCQGLQYKKLKYGNWQLSNTAPNNCLIMTDGSVVEIENIIRESNSIFIIGGRFLSNDNFFHLTST